VEVLTQTLPAAFAAAISELEGLPVVGAALTGAGADWDGEVAAELAGAAGFVALEPDCAFAEALAMLNTTTSQQVSNQKVSFT